MIFSFAISRLTTKIYSATKKLNSLFLFHLSNLYFQISPELRLEEEVKLGWGILQIFNLIFNSKEIFLLIPLVWLSLYNRGVKIIFIRGHISLPVSFRGLK